MDRRTDWATCHCLPIGCRFKLNTQSIEPYNIVIELRICFGKVVKEHINFVGNNQFAIVYCFILVIKLRVCLPIASVCGFVGVNLGFILHVERLIKLIP